jgi:hypothetical protein
LIVIILLLFRHPCIFSNIFLLWLIIPIYWIWYLFWSLWHRFWVFEYIIDIVARRPCWANWPAYILCILYIYLLILF